jgi:hypothetical protein
LQRNRFPFPRRRSLRCGGDAPDIDADCIRLSPPIANAEGFFIGFCPHLELWRVRLPGFDRYGVIDDELGPIGCREAIADAADAIRDTDPQLADKMLAIAEGLDRN